MKHDTQHNSRLLLCWVSQKSNVNRVLNVFMTSVFTINVVAPWKQSQLLWLMSTLNKKNDLLECPKNGKIVKKWFWGYFVLKFTIFGSYLQLYKQKKTLWKSLKSTNGWGNVWNVKNICSFFQTVRIQIFTGRQKNLRKTEKRR
jgi:hypothetical protein